MYSNAADCSSSRDGQLRRLTSSFFRVAKNVSATAFRPAARERHLERVDDEARAHVRRHRPAHDLAGVRVLDRGQIEPALPGPQVSDVRDPQHVRAIGSELPLDEICGRGDPRDPDRRPPALAGPDA
jgi:hypothetical protein